MSKRFSLREYQESMFARMKGVTAISQADARLGVEIGGRNWMVALADAAEVLPVPAVAHVPLTQPWFKGVANVRGNLMSVVDLQAFFGEGAQAVTSLSRLLLIQTKVLPHASVLVGRMLGIRHLADMAEQACPANAPVWMSACYRDAAGREWYELDIKRLAMEPAFLQTGIIA